MDQFRTYLRQLRTAKALRAVHRRMRVVAFGCGPLPREFEPVVELPLVDESDAKSMRDLVAGQRAKVSQLPIGLGGGLRFPGGRGRFAVVR